MISGRRTTAPFVHATGFHGRCYTRIAEQLGDIRHCWAPDLRAHGDSTIPADDRFHWSGMADDLCAVLDALGIDEPVDFVGHSMGGATVIATELRRPGTIRTAWLFEPIVFPPMGDNPSTMSEVARNRRASFDTIEAVLERYGSAHRFPRSTLRCSTTMSARLHAVAGGGHAQVRTPRARPARSKASTTRSMGASAVSMPTSP